MPKVVTRYAPSPTGNPHVGNIRTAIFAYLWARHNDGKFLLRIEDTDRERLVPESVKSIEESLHWLGLEYDDEKIFQSERKDIHLKFAEQLLSEGKAYKCYCSKDRLDELRQSQVEQKMPPGYDGHCRELSKEDVAKHEQNNDPYVIRFKMPKRGKAVWQDNIRDKMEIDFSVSDDPIIIKSDGWPTYHLASVVDDHESGVTDVIRGEEWISSTPKHLALYEALGWEAPVFSHMPHINGPDGSKLSKRHGDTAILDYREKGYLPEAMLNFLVLLGWNDGTENEYFSKEDLIKAFDIKRIGKSPSVFDIKKLDWMNGHYIRNLTTEELNNRITSLLPNNRIVNLPDFDRILEVEKSRLTTLGDITNETDYYVNLPKYSPELLIFKKSTKETTLKGLKAALLYIDVEKWPEKVEALNEALAGVAQKEELTNGDVFWPVRVALSGKEKSPSPAELLWVLGKEESVKRINTAVEELENAK
jgi:glutamyl-tRNA synthetase